MPCIIRKTPLYEYDSDSESEDSSSNAGPGSHHSGDGAPVEEVCNCLTVHCSKSADQSFPGIHYLNNEQNEVRDRPAVLSSCIALYCEQSLCVLRMCAHLSKQLVGVSLFPLDT